MDERLLEAVQHLVDRQAIIDCLQRYTRGVDRLDEDLVLSAFWEDATDHHTTHSGSPQSFVDWFWPSQPMRKTSQHYISNFTIEIDGDTAHCESYFFAPSRQVDSPTVLLSGGRYIDRLERRGGAWRIALRVVVTEWVAEAQGKELDLLDNLGRNRRDPSDFSYERPLEAAGVLVGA